MSRTDPATAEAASEVFTRYRSEGRAPAEAVWDGMRSLFLSANPQRTQGNEATMRPENTSGTTADDGAPGAVAAARGRARNQ